MITPNIFKENKQKKRTKATPTEIDNKLMMSQNKIAESVEAIQCCAERIAVTTENMDKYMLRLSVDQAEAMKLNRSYETNDRMRSGSNVNMADSDLDNLDKRLHKEIWS